MLSNPKLYLARPDRTIIADLSNEAYEIKYNSKLSSVSELTFKIPFDVEVGHQLIYNEHIDMILYKYLIKFETEGETLWFIIQKPTSDMNDEDSFEVQCYSLPFELTNRLVRSYSVTSKTLSEIMLDLLSETNWNIGYVNANFNTMYRSLEISSAKVLDAIYTCATTFSALIQWDTENKEINFYESSQFGNFRGLCFNYGKYLKELNQTINVDEFCTQLNIYGKDNLTINAANVSGSGYINDFSYFIYPYEESEEGNVLTSSNYMSDSLCHALLEYDELVATQTTIFSGYLTQQLLLQGDLVLLNSELDTLNTDLILIQASLDAAQSSGTSTTQLLIDQTNKQAEITVKESELANKKSEITVIETNISNLGILLDVENNFSSAQIIEMNDYIVVREVTNEYISDAQELLDWGKEQLLKINTPQILIEISSINIDQYLDEDCLLDKGKLILGTIVKIYHERFNIDIEAKIIEMDFDYENSDVKLTISNIEQMNKDFDKFLQKINQSINTTTQVDMNKYKWDEANIQANYVTSVLNNAWDAALRQIKAGTNESVDINNRGITLSSPSSPLESIRLMHNVIGCTLDGFNTLGVAISPRGVHANYLYGQVVASNNLLVTNTSGSFIVNGSGVTLDGMSLTITNKLPDSQISSAITWNQSVSDVATALSNASTAQETADGQIQGFFQISAPSTNISFGDIWIDTDGHTPPTTADIYRYEDINHGSQGILAWRSTPTNAIGIVYLNAYNAQSSANTAQSTANSKIKTFYQSTTPTASTIGDFWVDTDDNNHLYRWNGSTWVTVRDQSMVQQGQSYNGTVISPQNGIVVTKYNTGGIILADTTLNATTGIKIRKTSDNGITWTDKFYLDSLGNIVMSGSIVSSSFTGGTINIGTPIGGIYPFNVNSVGKITASNADISGTLRASAIYVGTTNILSQLSQLSSSISSSTLTTGLTSGITTISGNIHMGAGSTISWDSVTAPTASQVGARSNTWTPSSYDLPSAVVQKLGGDYTYLDATKIVSPYIEGGTIVGGSITSNTSINVNVSATIGESLILSSTSASGGIRWGTQAFAPAIYIDPINNSLNLYINGGAIYANGNRIDTASATAVFG